MKHPERRLFVEGGGDNDALRTECRRAFSKLLARAGLIGRMPAVVACGGRQQAYERFKQALDGAGDRDVHVLLVDAEEALAAGSPWDHVGQRQGDGWVRPDAATDDHLHLMVQCMESWLLADRDALQKFFGKGFAPGSLPAGPVESTGKREVLKALAQATQQCEGQGRYDKGRHSFRLLEALDPARLRAASPMAARFFTTLDRLLT